MAAALFTAVTAREDRLLHPARGERIGEADSPGPLLAEADACEAAWRAIAADQTALPLPLRDRTGGPATLRAEHTTASGECRWTLHCVADGVAMRLNGPRRTRPLAALAQWLAKYGGDVHPEDEARLHQLVSDAGLGRALQQPSFRGGRGLQVKVEEPADAPQGLFEPPRRCPRCAQHGVDAPALPGMSFCRAHGPVTQQEAVEARQVLDRRTAMVRVKLEPAMPVTPAPTQLAPGSWVYEPAQQAAQAAEQAERHMQAILASRAAGRSSTTQASQPKRAATLPEPPASGHMTQPVPEVHSEEDLAEWLRCGDRLLPEDAAAQQRHPVPTLRRVPSAFEGAWTSIIADIGAAHAWAFCHAEEALEEFELLLYLLPRLLLTEPPPPAPGEAKRSAAYRRHVHLTARFELFYQGKFYQLLADALEAWPRRTKQTEGQAAAHTDEEDARIRADRAVGLIERGCIGRAAQLLTSQGIAPATQGTTELIRQTVNEAAGSAADLPSATWRDGVAPAPAMDEKTLRRTLQQLPRMAAQDVIGWSGELLQALLVHGPALQVFLQIMQALRRGTLTSTTYDLLAVGRVTPLCKGTKQKVRPLVSGAIWRKLVMSTVCEEEKQAFRSILGLEQYAVGLEAALEKQTHTVRQLLARRPGDILIQLDARSAFNYIDRSTMLRELQATSPHNAQLWAQWLTRPSVLLYPQANGTTAEIVCHAGVDQGCPGSPFAFALGMSVAMRRARAWLADALDAGSPAPAVAAAGPDAQTQPAEHAAWEQTAIAQLEAWAARLPQSPAAPPGNGHGALAGASGPEPQAMQIAPVASLLQHVWESQARSRQQIADATADMKMVSFLDDLTCLSPPEHAEATYVCMKAGLASVGLELNEAKCLAWSPAAPRPAGGVLSAIWAKAEGITLVGCPFADREDPEFDQHAPIGSGAYAERFCWEYRGKLQGLLTEICALPHRCSPTRQGLQAANLLLRHCVSSRMAHLCRVLPPPAVREAAEAIDRDVARAFESINALPELETEDWRATARRLPMRYGGLGIRTLTDSSEASWLGAIAQAGPHLAEAVGSNFVDERDPAHAMAVDAAVRMASRIQEAPAESGKVAWEALGIGLADLNDTGVVKGQKLLSDALHESTFAKWTASLPPLPRATVLSCASLDGPKGASDWLTTAPRCALTAMSDDAYKIAMRQRLHLPVAVTGAACAYTPLSSQVRCCKPLTATADHAHSCSFSQRIARHNAMRDLFCDFYRQAGCYATVEQAVTEIGHEVAPKADIRAAGGPASPVTYADVQITHTARYCNQADSWTAGPPGAAAHAAELTKKRHYRPKQGGRPVAMLPLVWETTGRWGKSAAGELRRLARLRASLARRGGTADADAVYRATLGRWRREAGVCLQTHNAAVIAAAVGFDAALACHRAVAQCSDVIPESC